MNSKVSKKYSAQALIDHWKWAVNNNKMKPSTANAWQSACKKVLTVLGYDLVSTDVRTIDIDTVLSAFSQYKDQFKPVSFANYKTRFKSALQSYLNFLADEQNWNLSTKPKTKPKVNKRKKVIKKVSRKAKQKPAKTTPTRRVKTKVKIQNKRAKIVMPKSKELIEYKFLLRKNLITKLALPIDLNSKEAVRLSEFIKALPLDR